MGKEWDRLNAEKRGNATLMPNSERNYRHDGRENVGGRLSRTAAPPTPKKNPRCRRCDRLKTDKEPYRCKCENPDWDTRTREFGWQMQQWHQAWATEALRVLKPGGHLLAFGGTRTYHRLACAIEDAGFEIRDSVMWCYGSGFPKSLDVSKAIVGRSTKGAASEGLYQLGIDGQRDYNFTAPATPEAAQWEGWGTALKPAHEPIVVARKPLVGTVAQNVLEHGTGALNIDGCRVEGGERPLREPKGEDGNIYGAGLEGGLAVGETTAGRWPANVVLSPEAAAELDEQSGERVSGWRDSDAGTDTAGASFSTSPKARTGAHYGDTGGASRFYYTAKSSRAERSAGLNGERNIHPTCKPVELMRWLVRLVSPPGARILDPFLGSGTTGCAAVLEGFDFIGIEREPEYVEIARARIEWWSQFPGEDTDAILARHGASERIRKEHDERGQLGLMEDAA